MSLSLGIHTHISVRVAMMGTKMKNCGLDRGPKRVVQFLSREKTFRTWLNTNPSKILFHWFPSTLRKRARKLSFGTLLIVIAKCVAGFATKNITQTASHPMENNLKGT